LEPGAAAARSFTGPLGSPITDGNAEFQDFSPGYYITWGKFNPVSSMDDWFLAELTLIWHCNPVYTNIQWYHYVAESRYNGGEVITIAPDYSPSAIHADHHLPVRIGTDAALALSMCKVVIDEGLYNKRFVQEQTDLSLLVRTDTGRFLRGNEIAIGEREPVYTVGEDGMARIELEPTTVSGEVVLHFKFADQHEQAGGIAGVCPPGSLQPVLGHRRRLRQRPRVAAGVVVQSGVDHADVRPAQGPPGLVPGPPERGKDDAHGRDEDRRQRRQLAIGHQWGTDRRRGRRRRDQRLGPPHDLHPRQRPLRQVSRRVRDVAGAQCGHCVGDVGVHRGKCRLRGQPRGHLLRLGRLAPAQHVIYE